MFLALCAAGLMGLAACGGGGGSGADASATAPVAPPVAGGDGPGAAPSASTASMADNTVPLTVSPGTTANSVNLPQVSVRLCAPGTGICQTIDHVLVDTGSSGLRITAAAIDASLLAALPRESVGGVPLSACQLFAGGYSWGGMRVADVSLGARTAAAQPLQVMGDPAAGNVPAACEDSGTSMALNTPEELGTNGIIGLSSALQDCGADCAQRAIAGTYYACPGSGACTASAAPLALQAGNVVAAFAQDNNGVVLSLPDVAAQGQGTTVGTLYFGVGTQANNTLAGATVLRTDPSSFYVSASYRNQSYPESFLDSGSNFVYLDDTSIARCDGDYDAFYCPATPLSAVVRFATAAGGLLDQVLSIANAKALFNANPDAVAFDNVAGSFGFGGGTIDFGLPFFYGKRVAVLNEGQAAFGQLGPFTAIAPP